MKTKVKRLLLFFPLIYMGHFCNGQQTGYFFDSLTLVRPPFEFGKLTYIFYMPVFNSREYIIDREPYEGDTALIQSSRHLIKEGPNAGNYETYSSLAAALWRAGQTVAAKKLFLTIEQSGKPWYTGTQFHSAGNVYEYGSFTSNFKNEASLHLCKIYIEEKNYKKALSSLIKADKTYTIQYNCGTGAMQYANQLNSLYAACYSGLGLADKVIDLYLKENFYNDESLPGIIKKKYPAAEIKRYLQLAIDNITIVKDPFITETFMESGETNRDSLVEKYNSGTATTVLFGRKTALPKPELKNGETVTRQHFINEFINSSFYAALLTP